MASRELTVLKALLGFAIVSTALHFTHNVVEIDQYPPAGFVSDTAVQIAAVISWPLFTAIALVGYRRYAAGRYGSAQPMLAAYGVFCMVTLGHFTSGNPDIPAFWYATIFTDAIAGVAILAFTAWSLSVRRPGNEAPLDSTRAL